MKRIDFLRYMAGGVFLRSSLCSTEGKSIENESSKQKSQISTLDLSYLLNKNLEDYNETREVWDILHTIATLQGIINRNKPELYIYYVEDNYKKINIDRFWWDVFIQSGTWLKGHPIKKYTNVIDLISDYQPRISGIVLYDPNVSSTSNVASAISGIENLIAVRFDKSNNSLYSQIISKCPDIKIKIRLVKEDGSPMFTGKGRIPGTKRLSSGSTKNDAYLWFLEKYMKEDKFNPHYGAYYIDQEWMKTPNNSVINHHCLTNHDFFVSKKAFFFDLSPWSDEAATDESSQPVGTDSRTLKELLLEAYNRGGNENMIYIGGFPSWAFKYTKNGNVGGKHGEVETEWEYTKLISAYNGFQDADAIGNGAMANSSFWQHFPLEKKYRQNWVKEEELISKGYLNENGEVDFRGRKFIIFYVGDYDSSAWVYQTIPSIWNDEARGKIPLMWCISPVLEERVPMTLVYQRMTATQNDYFAAADNGAGYLNPGMLQVPRAISNLPSGLRAWAKHCKSYYYRWDYSITGFVIDGFAPEMNNKALSCYLSFSPNGIVPQKVKTTYLYRDMPILKSGPDIVDSDPEIAAQNIVASSLNNEFPFQWYRTILKTPSWHNKVIQNINKKTSEIELLEAPVFFELLRRFLHNSK